MKKSLLICNLCVFTALTLLLPSRITMASNDISEVQRFYNSPKAGKTIDFVGDSTTEAAPELFERIAVTYAGGGGPLEGVKINNRGTSGNTLHKFVNNKADNGNTIDKVIQDNADLYIVSYGINDIRCAGGMAGSSQDQIKADLKLTVDRLLNETKGNILLRIPNPFLTVNPPNLTLVSPIENAQLYSDQLWDIYESFKNYNARVDIIDIPSLVFGRQAMPEHPFMHDTLHPNEEGYRAIADALVDRITGKTKDEAISQSFAQETPVNQTIAILREEKLYNGVPYESGAGSAFSGATIAPQTAQAVARLNGYYKIKTWLGEKWINPLGGILEVTPASAGETLRLTENTFLLENPYAVNSGREGWLFLTPQQVKVLDHWKGYAYWDEGDYYRIQTWLGPKWINLKYSFPGSVQPTTETIEVSSLTDLNKYPWPDSYKLGKIAPQKVTAFEMADGWYHIHSWAGDAWITK